MTLVLTVLALAIPVSGDQAEQVAGNKMAGDGHVRCHKQCRSRRHKRRVVRPYSAKLDRMAHCESTGRWHISTGNGFYGGLQFTLRTWHSVGGDGYPHRHSKLEQKFRAVKLIKQAGYGPWPVCGSS